MRLVAGTRIGHYEIVALLGHGGMGAVYEARDSRLDRTVAIKVLRKPRSADQRRFVREAQAIAALQHPHICTLHDVGSYEGVDYLVMERVNGGILQGPLPLAKVIEYGVQIADALDAAHRNQITHRDLKPGNIMLTRSGVKVLDFGIARKTGDDTLTEEGVVVGTPAYMAPEQRAGGSTDARTDIYGLGCLLIEMATGRNDPRQRIEPAALDAVIKGCVAEDPDDRWQSARDVRRILESIDLSAAQPPQRRRWPWIAAALAALAAGAWLAWAFKPAAAPRVFQLSIVPPRDSTFLVARRYEGGLALSPDGTMLAFVARTGGRIQLWIQRLDSPEARPVPGTERAYNPFWSPDSRQIAFYTPGNLKKVAIDGGSVQTICQTDPRAPGGAWMPGDVLLVTGRPGGGIHRISVAGGDSQFLVAGAWPHPLPDGERFVFTSADAIAVGSLQPGVESRRLLDVRTPMVAYSRGHLLFVRDRTLLAQRFDPATLDVSGQPIPIANSVLTTRSFGSARFPGNTVDETVSFSATRDGLLAYAAGEPLNRLRWRDRAGNPLGELGEAGENQTPRISPDGSRVVFARVTRGNTDLWIAGPDRVASRLTFEPVVDEYPIWSADGRTITFASGPSGAFDSFRRAADGTGAVEQLTFDRGAQHSMDWSTDGRFLSLTRNSIEFGTDLQVLPAGQKTPYVFLHTKVSEAHSQFGPGTPPRWIAYSSDDSGRREIYVSAFVPGEAASGARWQISRDGGTMPRWRGDGRELFYWGLDGRIMAVDVNGDRAAFQAGTPVALFQAHTPTLRTNAIEFDVTRDGQKLLLVEPAEQTMFQSLSLVTNWSASAGR